MKNKKEQYKRLINFGARLFVLLGEGWIFAIIWYSCYADSIHFYRRGNWATIGIYLILVLFFTQNLGGFQIGYKRITEMALSQTIAIICANVVEYILIVMLNRHYVSISPMVYLTMVELLFVLPWIYLTRRAFTHLYPPHKVVVVYGGPRPDSFIAKINRRNDKYNVCRVIDIEEGAQAVSECILQYEAVVICDVPSGKRNLILKYCFRHSIRTYIVPKISDVIIKGADEIHLFDTPLYLSRNQGLTADQKLIKRTMDILLSGIILIVGTPFMLAAAGIIKCTDGGPVFYVQKRLTKDGREFDMVKFRTMYVDSEKAGGARLASKDDERVTPVGRILRRIHFDELPQLWNIFRGEMSLVGPRPERPEIAAQYRENIPEFDFRLKVKAGLTGYAQVYGKYNTTPYNKLKLDLIYIQNYSILQDIRILLMTIRTIFQKDNTEGVERNQTIAELTYYERQMEWEKTQHEAAVTKEQEKKS